MRKRLLTEIQGRAYNLQGEIINWRRHFHANPELSFQESKTADFIANVLHNMGISYITGVGGTGVVGIIDARNAGKTIGLRADMDALPVQEENEVPYKSNYPGIMHACGHDAHIAMLLGTAQILATMKPYFRGRIVLIFQPAEEIGSGAIAMARSKKLPPLDALIALHVGIYDLPPGKVGLWGGPVMAAADFFEAEIVGQGGHAAAPHKTINPIPPLARWILTSQEIIPQEVDPHIATVLNLAHVSAGTNANVVPPKAVAEGTIRTFSNVVRTYIISRLEKSLSLVAQAGRAGSHFRITKSFPLTVNNPSLVTYAREVLSPILENEALKEEKPMPTMVSEDVSLLTEAPLLYVFLGSAPKGQAFPNHHPRFNIDESILPLGTAIESILAISLSLSFPIQG